MGFNKKFYQTGGLVASTPPSGGAFDPLQNFETVTYTGNGSTQKITGYIRKGAAFNGSSSNISIGSVGMGVNDFTYSFWFNTNNITTANANIISPSADHGSYGLQLNTSGLGVYPHTGDYLISSTGIISPNTWYHVAYVKSSTAGHTLYLNGSPIATDANFTGNYNAATGSVTKFGSAVNNIQWFSGKLDQVRFFNTALNPTQVGELALETYADPKKSTTDYFGDGSGVALYELDEDSLSSNFKQAAVFNGSSSYVDITPKPSLADATVSFWLNTTTTETFSGLFGTGWEDVGSGARWGYLQILLQSGKIDVRYGNPTTGQESAQVKSLSSVNTGSWVHCTISINNTELKIYVNSSLETTHPLAFTRADTTNPISIGAYRQQSTLAGFLNGKIDQVRIFNTTLGQADVTKLYQESSTIPTANLIAHYKLDGDATDALDTHNGVATAVTYSNGVYGGTATNVNYLGMAFQPDLVWIKRRDNAVGDTNHFLFDSIRGATYRLFSNTTNSSIADTDSLTSFDSNGFTVSSDISCNGSGGDHVAWCWKAADTTTTIPAGTVGNTIASDVRANTQAGFSIVTWTGLGNNGQTVAHGLGAPPELIITKCRNLSGEHWYTYSEEIGNTKYLALNLTAQARTATEAGYSAGSNFWNDTSPTSSVFSLGNINEIKNNNHVAYCFHSVPGYQKVGSYNGDGTNNASNIQNIGFKPRFLLVRSYNGVDNWHIFDSQRDSVNPNNKILQPNTSNAELTYTYGINFLDNGFVPENAWFNGSSESFIYLAIA